MCKCPDMRRPLASLALTLVLVLLAWSTAAQAQDTTPFEPTLGGEEEEESIEELEERLVPTAWLPEFRIRAGGGIGIPLGGTSVILGRATQEVEWQIPEAEFIFVGLGAAEIFGSGVTVEAGARVGGLATFCEDRIVRCHGAITLQIGFLYGELAPAGAFDIAADVDVRFLFVNIFELFVRGGFFTAPGPNSFINVTAGLAIAF